MILSRQAKKLVEQWEEDDRREPIIVEKGVFGDEGGLSKFQIQLLTKISSISTSMVTPSDAQRLQEDEGDQGTS